MQVRTQSELNNLDLQLMDTVKFRQDGRLVIGQVRGRCIGPIDTAYIDVMISGKIIPGVRLTNIEEVIPNADYRAQRAAGTILVA